MCECEKEKKCNGCFAYTGCICKHCIIIENLLKSEVIWENEKHLLCKPKDYKERDDCPYWIPLKDWKNRHGTLYDSKALERGGGPYQNQHMTFLPWSKNY